MKQDQKTPAPSHTAAGCLPAGPWAVAFEGIDGVGKSTQAALLGAALRAAGRAVVETRQPGDAPGLGPSGSAARDLVLDPDGDLTSQARHLLFAADNAQNTARVILPALAAGQIVVIDRGPGSALAYQGFGDQIGTRRVAATYGWATRWFWPSVVVELRGEQRARPGRPDFIESRPSEYHQRVREGYQRLAVSLPRWLTVAGEPDDSPEDVLQKVSAALAAAEISDRALTSPPPLSPAQDLQPGAPPAGSPWGSFLIH